MGRLRQRGPARGAVPSARRAAALAPGLLPERGGHDEPAAARAPGGPRRGNPTIDRRVLALGALEPAEAEGLALVLLDCEGPAARARAAAIARESGGNPFFVAELVRSVLA